jgi:hypothetical protein
MEFLQFGPLFKSGFQAGMVKHGGQVGVFTSGCACRVSWFPFFMEYALLEGIHPIKYSLGYRFPSVRINP